MWYLWLISFARKVVSLYLLCRMDMSPSSRGSDGLAAGEHLRNPLPGRVLVPGDGPARGPCRALPHGRCGWAAVPRRGHRLPGMAWHRSPGEPHRLGVLGLHGSVSGLLGRSERRRRWPHSRYTQPPTNQHSLAHCLRTHFSPLINIVTLLSTLLLSQS